MELGQNEANPRAIMSMLEQYAHSKGWGAALENNQMWNSFKTRQPDEIVPHAQKMMKNMGKLDLAMKFFTGGNQQQQPQHGGDDVIDMRQKSPYN